MAWTTPTRYPNSAEQANNEDFLNVNVILADDTAAVTIPIRTGVITPIRATRIRVTGTDASNVIALY